MKPLASDFDLPAWAKWIAQDKSGAWWAFEQEPNQGHDFWYENEVGRYQKISKTCANPESSPNLKPGLNPELNQKPNLKWHQTLQRI